MALISESELWKRIDISESYLVCCMFEEAASESASIIRNLHTTAFTEVIDEAQLAEVMTSAGMVYVQSLKETGRDLLISFRKVTGYKLMRIIFYRTSELFIGLLTLFGSVAAIPVDVFLTGACMQLSEGLTSNIKEVFEEFLGKWTHVGEVYVLLEAKPQGTSSEGYIGKSVMHADKYAEVAEVYAITFLGMVLRNPDLAISWTERAELPEEKRQDMLRRLRSLCFAQETSSSPGRETIQTDVSGTGSSVSLREAIPKTKKPHRPSNGDKSKSSPSNFVLRISQRIDPCFWWYRSVRLKLGNLQFVFPRGKLMFLGFLIFLTYIIRKRSAVLKRILSRQALSVKRALVDAWQLAFSVQVNPLAAVQQLPAAPRR